MKSLLTLLWNDGDASAFALYLAGLGSLVALMTRLVGVW